MLLAAFVLTTGRRAVGQGEARRGEAGPGKGTAWQGKGRGAISPAFLLCPAIPLLFITRRIDDFRFRWRFGSRADAIRWLLAWALDRGPSRDKDSPQ